MCQEQMSFTRYLKFSLEETNFLDSIFFPFLSLTYSSYFLVSVSFIFYLSICQA